jgi:hypothetical protein
MVLANDVGLGHCQSHTDPEYTRHLGRRKPVYQQLEHVLERLSLVLDSSQAVTDRQPQTDFGFKDALLQQACDLDYSRVCLTAK